MSPISFTEQNRALWLFIYVKFAYFNLKIINKPDSTEGVWCYNSVTPAIWPWLPPRAIMQMCLTPVFISGRLWQYVCRWSKGKEKLRKGTHCQRDMRAI
jgi:hypothetical protein